MAESDRQCGRLRDALARFPRETLTRTPTPLEYLPTLSAQLEVNLYIKRDDLTDLALGGDKPRKLEYEIAAARARGADTLVTCGSSQSNHARLTTAAARRLGMSCALALTRDERMALQGNLLTVRLMGAEIEFVDTDDHWALEEHALALCDRLRRAGRTPHYIPVSGTTAVSCLGYVRGAIEIIDQLAHLKLSLDGVYTPFGTGGIFTAMLLTFRVFGLEAAFHAVSVNRERRFCQENLDKWWAALCELLAVHEPPGRGSHQLFDDYIGREYGDPTAAGLEAIVRFARAEGILLDPVYSGKTASGFLAQHAAGRWPAGSTILLLHSGGVPALFAYSQEIGEFLDQPPRNVCSRPGYIPK